MDFDDLPLFSELAPSQRAKVLALARQRTLVSGDMLFYEGDPADNLTLLVSGHVTLTHAGMPKGDASPGQFLDLASSLAGLVHSVKATATQTCEVSTWPMDDLWRLSEFQRVARQLLGRSLRQIEARLTEVTAPVHYSNGAGLAVGPFAFNNATLLIAFCEADRDVISTMLPDGLSLLATPNRQRAPIFMGLADFPDAFPEHAPQDRFEYTETTVFVPVRCGANPGVFIPYIYPSSWEPILIGREVYGFPKRLGQTDFGPNRAELSVDGEAQLQLGWEGLEASDEPDLVGALMAWLGIERHIASAAFQMGDTLRMAAGLPAYRRIDVYSQKRILSVDATHHAPKYAIDQMIHAVFGVMQWFSISKMKDPTLTITGGPLIEANLTLREAYRTQLDMRLSVGEVIKHY